MSLFCSLLVIPNGAALAQSIPKSADISHIPKQQRQPFKTGLVPSSPQAENKTDTTGDINIVGAEKIVLTFTDLEFKGMEAYPPHYFDYLFNPYKGKKVTLDKVINIINSINKIYRRDGFILSSFSLPEQDITSGTVTVEVNEGRILNVYQENARQDTPALRHYFDKIVQIYPFNIHEFEHWMLSLNNLSGSRFRSVLRRPEHSNIAGEIDVVILEDKTDDEITASINNFGSLYAGPWQFSVDGTQSDIINPYDQISMMLSTVYPIKEVRYGEIGYKIPVYSIPGLFFKTAASWGGTESGDSLKTLEIKGYSHKFNIGLLYHHLLSRRSNWISEAGFDFKNTRSKVLGDELYDDRLRVLRAKTTWQYLDSLNGVSLLSSEISHGLNALGTRESGSFNLSREDGKSDFTKITAQATRVQELPYFLQGFLQVTGQYSFTPVLSSEEFGYGGMPNGRGLDPSELTGDHGLSATLEVRYNGLPRKGHWGVIPYSFVDFGKVWQKGVDADNAETSFSTGVGARITNGDSNSIELLMAVPLTKDADNPPPYGNGESPRFLISYSKSF